MNVVMCSRLWTKVENKDLTIYWRATGSDLNTDFILETIDIDQNNNKVIFHNISKFCNSINGGFAFVIMCENYIITAVDIVRSIPLYFNKDAVVSDSARYVLSVSPDKSCNSDSIMEISRSGYSISNKTLYNSVSILCAGQLAIMRVNNCKIYSYYSYVGRKARDTSFSSMSNILLDHIFGFAERIKSDYYGREIVVPLSAGVDSRLIVSALKYVGIKNVTCFSYGYKASFEIKAARAVAEHLGFNFIAIDTDRRETKKYYKTDEFKDYFYKMDSLSSVPYISESYQISYLVNNNLISSDAVIINGNTGDFISGGHIPYDLSKSDYLLTEKEYIKKHYSLWGKLIENKSNSRVWINTIESIKKRGIDVESLSAPALYELAEYCGRQSHLIVGNQQVYDYFDLDWHMPLWSRDYVDFWSSVPYEYKMQKKLYLDTIKNKNICGVWKDIPINRKTIRPKWLIPYRIALKGSLFLMNNTEEWNSIEKRLVYYFLEPYRNYYPESFIKVVSDNRQQRYYFSWWTERYLNSHGISLGNNVK
jgi:asparagine synthase (glutamine-hydrolysing)